MQIEFEKPRLRFFDKAEYAEQFASGRFLLSTIKRYRQMEEDDPDIGDSYEGIRTLPAQLLPNLSHESLAEGYAEEIMHSGSNPTIDIPIRIPEVEESVLLCSTALSVGALESAGTDRGRYLAQFGNQYLEFLNRHTHDFTEGYGVIFPEEEMNEKLGELAASNDLAFLSRIVEYGEPRLSNQDIADMRNGCPAIYKFLFHKRKTYMDQFEFRFALLPQPGEIDGRLSNMLDDRGFLTIESEPFKKIELIYFQE